MRCRPDRMKHIAGIGVDRMGAIADAFGVDFLRLENLDVDIPPDGDAVLRTQRAAGIDGDKNYLPFVGQRRLRTIAAHHVSQASGVPYSGERNCVISAGGLSGILNVLPATIEVSDEVIVTDPTYAGLINRIRLVGGYTNGAWAGSWGLRSSCPILPPCRSPMWSRRSASRAFRGQSAAFGVGKTKAPPTQARFEHAVLLLQILDDIQLMAVDPASEHPQ
jgi:hypothetical protein